MGQAHTMGNPWDGHGQAIGNSCAYLADWGTASKQVIKQASKQSKTQQSKVKRSKANHNKQVTKQSNRAMHIKAKHSKA